MPKKKNSSRADAPKPAKTKSTKLNLEEFLDIKDYATLNPEKLTITELEMSSETLNFMLEGLGYSVNVGAVVTLWGKKVTTDDEIVFGRVVIYGQKRRPFKTVNVAEE